MTFKRTQPPLGTGLMSLVAERANRRAIANARAALTLLKRRPVDYAALSGDLDQMLAARESHLVAQDAARRRQDRALLDAVGPG